MKCDNCNGLMTPEHNEAYIETMGGLHFCSQHCLEMHWEKAERAEKKEQLEGYEVAEKTRRLVVENLLHFWHDPMMRRFLIGVIKRADELQIEIEDLERNSGFGRD